MNTLDAITAALPHLPAEFRDRLARLWHPDHLSRLARNLDRFAAEGMAVPLPHFAAEVTPPVGPVFEKVRPLMSGHHPTELAGGFAEIGCDGLLLLMGQRRTPASLTDETGIPPTDAELWASATARHSPNDALTVVARALAKHCHRSTEAFWGTATGPTAARNAHAEAVLRQILDGRTWWNVFGHFAHETVFEARLPTGHGARWGEGGEKFIGFLEPFDEALCPSLNADGPAAAPDLPAGSGQS